MKVRKTIAKIGWLSLATYSTYLYMKYRAWVYTVPSGQVSQLDYFISAILTVPLFLLWLYALLC